MANTIDLATKKEFLKKQACFSQFTDEETEVLASLLVEQQVSPGTTIVTEGDPVDSVYLIVKGMADVRHITLRDNVTHIESVAKLGPNEAIGLNEAGFYSLSGIRTATVVAISEMTLLRLSVATFHGFALTYSHVNEVMRKNAEAFLNAKI